MGHFLITARCCALQVLLCIHCPMHFEICKTQAQLRVRSIWIQI